MIATNDGSIEYVLGHSEQELDRLEYQAQFLLRLTRDLLVRAGIGSGMRVLDFGAGAGDVSILAAELVGPGGEVVAIERSADAIAHARQRLERRNIRNVQLVHGDESAIPQAMGARPFDALVGRLVLVHQSDLCATFVKLTKFVRPGGIVAFQEPDVDASIWSSTHLPVFERAWQLIIRTFMGGGMASNISARLRQAFDAANITDSRFIREGLLESGNESHAYEFLSRTVRSLMPAMTKLGLATESELDIDTLAHRMREEAVQAHAFFIPVYLIAACGRTRC